MPSFVYHRVPATRFSLTLARLALAAAFTTCLAFAGGPADAATKLKKNTGYSSIVIDATSGAVLQEENADAQRYPASLTKMMTLYLLFQSLDTKKVDLNTVLPVSSHAASQSPTKLGLEAGDRIAVRDIILGLVTQSANDAAVVAAEGLGGSEEHFGEMMTAQARRLGMTSTVYRNASGLPDPGQITTARDLVKLSRALIRDYPHYYSYFSTTEFAFSGRRFANHNHLMSWYEGADGIKTGFINASGFNLAASAVRDKRRLIGVVLGGPSARTRDQYMGRLLDGAFARASGLPETREAVLPYSGKGGVQVAVSMPKQAASPKLVLKKQEKRPAPEMAVQAKAAAIQALGPEREESIRSVAKTGAADGWAVQVGAFNRSEAARVAAEAATKLAPAQLRDADIDVSALARNKKATVYRAGLTGLSETEAREACKVLEKKHRDCLVMSQTDLRASVRVANKN